MKIHSLILAPLALASVSDARLHQPESDHRKLLGATTINNVIDFFVPILNLAIQTSFALVDFANPLDQSVEIPEVDFGICTTSASVGYSLGTITGFETFQITEWELVPGTDLWDSSFLGFSGSKWNGTWIFTAEMDQLESRVGANIAAGVCDIGIDESIGGSIVAENPKLNLRVQIAGESPNLLFLGYSFANSIDFQEASITYDSLLMNIGGFGTDIEFDIDAFLQEAFNNNLNENVLPAMLDSLNNDFSNGLSFRN